MVGLLILLATALAVMLAALTALLAREMRRPPRHTTAYALAKGLPCDPGDLDPPLPYEEWWLDRPDGAQLPVWDISNPNSGIQIADSPRRNSKVTAVFLHGWGHSRVDVLPRIGSFLPFCDRIVLYDLRGHGESRHCLSNLGMKEDDDLLALLERLGDSQRFLLVGHSMGAVIALKATAEARRRNLPIADQIAGIIVYGAYCDFHRSLQGRLNVAGYPARPITDLALLVHRFSGLTPLSLREADVQAFESPVLMIHGCDDQIAPLEHGQRLAQAVKTATLHEIRDAAHVDAHTVDVTHHNQIVREFLREIADDWQREEARSLPSGSDSSPLRRGVAPR
jgi:pimeloyl-ACP methyl ester carboxylesterase